MDEHRMEAKGGAVETSSAQQQAESPSATATNGPSFEAPSINLPKGGGAIRGIGEKFNANPVTGTGSMTVPIATSPGRSGFGPELSLAYNSGSGNGVFGLGWSLSLPSITRKTDKGLPRYQDKFESDEFILSGSEDLVPCLERDAAGNWQPQSEQTRVIDNETYEVRRYRPRVEGLFARIEKWFKQDDPEIVFWRAISRENVTTWYGKTSQSRLFDQSGPTRIYSWLVCESYDDKGNAIKYEYAREDSANLDLRPVHEQNRAAVHRESNRYIKRIKYGNRNPFLPVLDINQPWPALPGDDQWLFEVVFDYGDNHYAVLEPVQGTPVDQQHVLVNASSEGLSASWTPRPDPFSTYRPGFELRTYRRCERVMMFHHFDELGSEPYLVRSTEFDYHDLEYDDEVDFDTELGHAGSTRFLSHIQAVTQSGYVHHTEAPIREEDVAIQGGVRYVTYIKKSLPPLEFEYSSATIQDRLEIVEDEELVNLPQGLDGSLYQWVDIDGEGPGGIITEQEGAWYYKRNLSPLPVEDEDGTRSTVARFGPLERISPLPNFSRLAAGSDRLLDLAADGQLDVVTLDEPVPGFFERTDAGKWEQHRTFYKFPNIDWQNPNLKFVDVTGDGHADILISENEAFTWYQSLAETGFSEAELVRQALDESNGPKLIFADGTDTLYLSDFSGDGLSDLVRIRNGEICYWPNLGYGIFGRKITMDNSPWFDAPDQFDQKRIRLADIDGTGVSDILYLKRNGVDIYFNQSGNRWTTAHFLGHLPAIDDSTNVMTVDLLGNGTSCLVWSSSLPGHTAEPMRYIDLVGGYKPHLLTRVRNNLGAETVVHYAPSTKFYLQDKRDGKEWITRLHFPVQVVEKVETFDHISRNRFVSRYVYHHAFFDGIEREFRGWGMVEQLDTEEFETFKSNTGDSTASNIDESSHVPPVLTKTWFHTGAYLGRERVSNYFSGLDDARDIGEYYREPAWRNDDSEARKYVLEDTVLPDGLTTDEEREACRALKGSMLRQEVYALDGTGDSDYPCGHPYTVTEQNFGIVQIQPKVGENRHAVFLTHQQEVLTFHYERNSTDPRINHSMTLEVDPNYGLVRKSLAIGYGRRLSTLQGDDKSKQEQTLITYTENDFTNAIDQEPPGTDHGPDLFRYPLPSEARTYEITGVNPGVGEWRYTFDYFASSNFRTLLELQEIEYQTLPDYARGQKRLIEQVRTQYRPDDFGESQNDPQQLLTLGIVEPLALSGETYRLAFTPALLAQIFSRNEQSLLGQDVSAILAGTGGNAGGYVYQGGRWWVPSGRVFYSNIQNHAPDDERDEAARHFFVPRRYRDPFHEIDGSWDTETFVDYDVYDLLVSETRDALGNLITSGKRNPADDALIQDGNDYRVLQPYLMMDPNRNCSEVAFDALGLVAGTAVMGKPEDSPAKGDRIDSSFRRNLTVAEIEEFFDANDPHVPAFNLLDSATSRIVYDLERYWRAANIDATDVSTPAPVFAAALERETHVSEPVPSEGTKIQISFSFSDGFGREIQKKVQAEPGKVAQRDADNGIAIDSNGQPVMTVNDVSPRWVGSGWTVYNNKGKAIRQFEPFFSDSHKPDFDCRIGVSPVLFYDPVERVVATLHPNHTYEKVVFDPWRQMTYDVNDTVTLDPRIDADVKTFVEKYLQGQGGNWETWLQQRNVDGNNPPPDTNGANPARDAAVRALNHANTPSTTHFDSLGRNILNVADNGNDSAGNARQYETRFQLDIEGNQREVIDAKQRVIMRYQYDMLGNRIRQASMEAGERWILNDIQGNPVRTWDSRGHNFITTYDRMRRPLERQVRGTDAEQSDSRTLNNDIVFEKTVYGEDRGNAVAANLRTRVFRLFDGAGVLTNEEYDFKGNLLASTREVASDFENVIDWSVSQPAGELYSSSTTFDALNRPTSFIAPDNSVVITSYNDANLLNGIKSNLRGATETTNYVTNIDYNAKGQRVRIDYGTSDGKGITTTYRYDPATFRLVNLKTRRNSERFDSTDRPGEVQNLQYSYDPAGNITHIKDLAQDTIFFNNRRVEPSNDYKYDAIYRLLEATGREHLGQAGGSALPPMASSYNDWSRINLPHPGDGNAMGAYREIYTYDEVGNLDSIAHRGTDPQHPGWARTFTYEEASLLEDLKHSNRLTETAVSSINETYSTDGDGYDAHGNMLSMPHLQTIQWDFRDRLLTTQRQKVNDDDESGIQRDGEQTWYVYDANGQRIRKVTKRASGEIKDERIYIGGFEVFRSYGINQVERQTLHIMDDKQRIALIETIVWEGGVLGAFGSLFFSPATLTRYQLGNHIGSASLEMDVDSQVITYEEYSPYGTTLYQAVRQDVDSSVKRYRYAGKERDEESGFVYFGSRFYMPWLGSWSSPDPLGIVDGPNLYIYVNNAPVNRIDIGGNLSYPGWWDPAALADKVDEAVNVAQDFYEVENTGLGSSLWNTVVATTATVVKGTANILRVGTGAAQGVEDIKRGLSEEGDAWDVAIGAARILSDAGEVAGAAAGAAGTTTKLASKVSVASKTKKLKSLRSEASTMSKNTSQFKRKAEDIGELESDIAAAKAGLQEVKGIRRTTKRGTEARQGIDKAYRGSRNLNPLSKGPKRRVVAIEAKGTSAPKSNPLDHLGNTKSFGKQMSDRWVKGNLKKASDSGTKGAKSLVDDLKLSDDLMEGFMPERILTVADTAGGSRLYSLSGQGNHLSSAQISSLAPELHMTLVPELVYGLGMMQSVERQAD